MYNFVEMHHRDYAEDEKGKRQFFISMFNTPEVSPVRALTAVTVGRLVTFSAVVTRTSEVRPELMFGTFLCLECNELNENIELLERRQGEAEAVGEIGRYKGWLGGL